MVATGTATAHTATPEAAEGKCARCLDTISSVLVHILGRWYCFGCVTELAMDKLTEEHDREQALLASVPPKTRPAATASSQPIAPPSPVRLAPSSGYTGNACLDCGGFQMVRSGTCERCLDCGATTGCS